MSNVSIGGLLAVRVKQVRLGCGLTQEKVAKSAGISVEALSAIERGKVTPSVETLESIANAFDIPLCILLNFKIKIGSDEANSDLQDKMKRLIQESDVNELNAIYDVASRIAAFWNGQRKERSGSDK